MKLKSRVSASSNACKELFTLRRSLVVKIIVNCLDELGCLEQEIFAKHCLGNGEQDKRGLVVKIFKLAVNDLGALLRVGDLVQVLTSIPATAIRLLADD